MIEESDCRRKARDLILIARDTVCFSYTTCEPSKVFICTITLMVL